MCSTQEQIVALLQALTAPHGLTLLFISHNLALVRRLCARVLVLYLGRMMELAPTQALFAAPRHPYTRELLAALPSTDPDVQPQRLAQVRARRAAIAAGSAERLRLPHALRHAQDACAARVPGWESVAAGHEVACLRWRDCPWTPLAAARAASLTVQPCAGAPRPVQLLFSVA